MSPYWSLITSHDLLTLSVIKNLALALNNNTTCHFKHERHEPCSNFGVHLFGNQRFRFSL